MENTVMVLFCCGLGVLLIKYTQGSQCVNKYKKQDLNWELFEGFIKIAFDNCTTFNTTLEWNTQPDEKTFCVLEQNRCFNWSCSCKDKNNVSSSLTTGDTTYKCSGHISSSDNTTAKQSYREASINQSDVIRIQPFSLSVGIAFGILVGSVLTFCVMHLCNSNLCRRQKRTKVPNHSTLSDEIPLCKREMNGTQNETLFNDELKPSPLYTEIAVNNECEHVHIVNSETVTDNEYLEPNPSIEDEPIIRPVEDRKSSNEYSHVYNHLKPNIRHDVEPDVCNPDNVTSSIYNVTVSNEKEDQCSETRTNNMDNNLESVAHNILW
ncbi:uncharacterized protein LOC111108446 isoform X3 [Crassostrea virginica]